MHSVGYDTWHTSTSSIVFGVVSVVDDSSEGSWPLASDGTATTNATAMTNAAAIVLALTSDPIWPAGGSSARSATDIERSAEGDRYGPAVFAERRPMRLSADIRLARRSRELATIQIRRSGLPESGHRIDAGPDHSLSPGISRSDVSC